ncbi:DUF1684 domain-containing protein [Curtobacterium ammoniigenes]|uniref:DUF1684 domain-containing protein n=1 Tax=Curtobacterium ammoniigenes TaxID=395387 RepID=UPI00082F7032|nr:DUF1684 domain-containing protein [Curtobacterium ammoniigenes]
MGLPAAARTAIDVADWRRRTFDCYRSVRAAADPAAAHALWQTSRDTMFREHPASPLLDEDRERFSALPVADYDPAWRFVLPVLEAPPAHLDVPTGTDGIVAFDRVGMVRIPDVGTLDVWWHAGYGGGLFVPVKDASAGTAGGTYGGGRYLLDTIKGADLGSSDGSIVIDCNFAYNPSCAYDPAWACPLAPPGNTVAVPIPVGERYPHATEREA